MKDPKSMRIDLEQWNTDGYLVLKDVFTSEYIETFNTHIDQLWENRKSEENPFMIDFWEGPLFAQRMHLRDAPEGSRKYIHKLSQLYLDMPACRDLSLHPRLTEALTKLLDAPPMIINSLLFEKGSQQPDHFDTYHMPPPNDGKLIVTSICLEDVHPDAGPVHYYPGSHKIPPYVFSDGQIRLSDKSERSAADAYARSEIEKRGIKKEVLSAQKGDVLIWHGQLYHGGGEINDPTRTRKTLVTHYWRQQDLIRKHLLREHAPGAYYLDRPHQQPSESV